MKAVMENTPPSRGSRAAGGLLGSFLISDLKPGVATAISSLTSGEFSEPVRFDYGYAIYRLDGRTHDSFRNYDDPDVQEQISRSITMSLAPAARERYVTQLRNRAHFEVCSDTK